MQGIVTEYHAICVMCGGPATEEHHLLFGSKRQLAEEDGIKVPCCRMCHTTGELIRRIHDNPAAERLSKIAGQLAWEKAYGTREDFRERYGESYL